MKIGNFVKYRDWYYLVFATNSNYIRLCALKQIKINDKIEIRSKDPIARVKNSDLHKLKLLKFELSTFYVENLKPAKYPNVYTRTRSIGEVVANLEGGFGLVVGSDNLYYSVYSFTKNSLMEYRANETRVLEKAFEIFP